MRLLMAILSAVTIAGTGVMAQQKDGESHSTRVCTIKVSGMFCGECAKTVEKAAKKVAGVTLARASQPKGVAEMTYDPAKTSPEAIAKAITQKTPFKAEVVPRR